MKVCTRHREASELCWQRAGELNPGLYAALSTSWPFLNYFGSAACCASNGAEKYGLTVWRSKRCQLLFTTWSWALTAFPKQSASFQLQQKKTHVSCPCALKKNPQICVFTLQKQQRKAKGLSLFQYTMYPKRGYCHHTGLDYIIIEPACPLQCIR